MVLRVWERRGVKVYQQLQLAYHWHSLFLVVDAQEGNLQWCWLNSMAEEQIVVVMGGLQSTRR